MKARLAPSALAVAVVGTALTMGLGAVIYTLQSVGKSAAAIAMAADMNMRDMRTYWSFPFLQSSGLVGLLFSYLGALLGLWQANCKAAGSAATPSLERLHRHVSLLVVSLVLVHMLATAFDAMGDSWRTVLIPGTWAQQGWPEAVFGYNTGIAAAYLLILVAPSFYMRRWLDRRRWRILHRLVLMFYALSIWHAMILGLDLAYYRWLRPAIWLAQIPLLLLLMLRLYRPMVSSQLAATQFGALKRYSCIALFVLSGLSCSALALIVLTGHSGFIATV